MNGQNASNPEKLVQRNLSTPSNGDLLIFDDGDNQRSSSEATPKTSLLQRSVQLRLTEKTIIALQNGKIKELKIFGQLLLEGEGDGQKLMLKLLSPIWEDAQALQKRVSPNSLEVSQIGAFLYEIGRDPGPQKSRSVFDYIVASKLFRIERIPLMVIYRSFESEKHKNDVVLAIQYKVNDLPEAELKDVEVEVLLEKEVFFDDLQTMPPAFSFHSHVLLWKVRAY